MNGGRREISTLRQSPFDKLRANGINQRFLREKAALWAAFIIYILDLRFRGDDILLLSCFRLLSLRPRTPFPSSFLPTPHAVDNCDTYLVQGENGTKNQKGHIAVAP